MSGVKKPAKPAPKPAAGKVRRPAKTHPQGRPTMCTPEVIERLCAEMEALGFVGAACARAGVAKSTVEEWVQRGKDGQEPFAEFAGRWAQARARANARHVEAIQASPDWRARAWLLERAAPDEYPRDPAVVVTQTVTGASDGAIALLRRLVDAPPEAPEDDPEAR